MKTKVSLLFSLLLITAFVLSACGTPATEAPVATEAPATEAPATTAPATEPPPLNPLAPSLSGLTTPAPRSCKTLPMKCSPRTTSNSWLN